MTKTKKKTKVDIVKWPVKKVINKFFVYNIFLTLGLAMLILSTTCMGAFDGNMTKIIGNIVASIIVFLVGLAGGIVYSICLTKKTETPLETKFSNLTKNFFWVPILGIVFDKIWKSKEKQKAYLLNLQADPDYKKPRFSLPNSITLIFAALVGVVFLIWILYLSGVVKTEVIEFGGVKYNTIPGILDIFLNPLRGFAGYTKTTGSNFISPGVWEKQTEYVTGVGTIIIFLLIFNGTMTLVNDSKAIDAGIAALLRKMKGKELILIPILMLILAICGSTFNMCEQLLPLFMVVIPIMFAAGFDIMTGFLMVNMGAGVGVMASTVNPVLIGTAIGSIPEEIKPEGFGMMTGIAWRLIMFAVLITTSIICTIVYAKRVKKNPQKSCVYLQEDQFKQRYTFDKDVVLPMTGKRKATLIVFGLAFLLMIVCFIDWQRITGFDGFKQLQEWLRSNFPFISSITPIGTWGMVEAAMLFFIAAIVIGAINWQSSSHFFDVFYKGCKDFIGVAFIVAVSKGLSITLSDSGVNEVIANGLGSALKAISAVVAVLLIFIVIAILTVFIPSSSGLASAMFPMISKSVAAAGAGTVSMSGAVTIFAAGMGWSNLFIPTGMVLPFCEYSKIEYTDFVKASWKQVLILLAVGLGLMSLGTLAPNLF